MQQVASFPKSDQDAICTVNVLGVQVSVHSLSETTSWIVRWAVGERMPNGPRYVCATSVHGVIEAQHDPEFRNTLNGASFVTADGVPLVWMGRLRGHKSMERVYGPALMKGICALSAGRDVRHFFYGGAPGVAVELAKRVSAEFPGLTVAGTYTPPFRPLSNEELDHVAHLMNESSSDIVWVGLSTPKQERWINRIRGRLRAKIMISVGAAFDFHTDRVPQAPPWMQDHGLEWLYRVSQEPNRLWRRYAYNNPRFLVLAMLQLMGLKDYSQSDADRHENRA